MDLWKGISWNEAVRIWWLLVWRSSLLGFLTGGILGFVLGLLNGLFSLGLPQWSYGVSGFIASLLFVPPFVISQMLRKRFRGFHLLIVREQSAPQIETIATL